MAKKYTSELKIALIDPRLLLLTREVKNSGKTFLDYSRLLSLAESVKQVNQEITGELQLAEFGVGRGGSATILAWLVDRFGGKLSLFDVFSRIPPPSDSDGELAQARYQNISQSESSEYYGNIPDLLGTLKAELGEVCSLDQIEFIQGKYEETLPALTGKRAYNFVHIDCDWYESTKAVHDYLKSNISENAIIQIDDYSFWPGTRNATDDAEWLHKYKKEIIEGALVIDTSKGVV